MAKHDLSKPLAEITFRCGTCYGHTFSAAPTQVEDAPEIEHHPFRYFADCPQCGARCEQAAYEQGLIKAWAHATGPKTPEGKAASAKNLEGHPTPEEALRTRFNAMKHGQAAKVATYFPAKPDGYAFCAQCEVDRSWCGKQAACVKQTQNFMLHHAAFEQRNPAVLSETYAGLHAALFTVLQQILQTIIADGAKIVSPEWYTNKDGDMLLATYLDPKTREEKTIMSIEAHPLFKPLAELLSRTGLTLTDMGMTVKAMEGEEDDEMGHLQGRQPASLEDFSRRQDEALKALRGQLDRGRAERDRDPVLLEYQQQNGGDA